MIAVGIDVSKSKSMVAIISSDGEILMQPTEYRHDIPSLSQLIVHLHSYKDEVKIAMESTGHYHHPVLKILLNEDFFISVVNPYVMKKYGDNVIRKCKTDKKDALRIAYYVLEKAHCLSKYSTTDQKYQDLQFLSRQYNQCIALKTKSWVQLTNLLDEIMPGALSILTLSPFFYKFLEKYESFDRIRKMREKTFLFSYVKLARSCACRNAQAKALKIYELATNSITTINSSTSTLLATKQCIALLIQSNESPMSLLFQMQSIAYTLPEYHIIISMNGVGNRLAPRLIAEIGDVRRFYSAKALNAYAGNDAPAFQSGQYESRNCHISKRGSASLRKACYEMMQALKLHKPAEDAVYQFILKKEAEGKPKKVAKMAGVNKFLRIYYARVMEIYK